MNNRPWSEQRVEEILVRVSGADIPSRIERISAEFLDVPYQANTLEPVTGNRERLVFRPDAVDCFTLLDYVDAMRTSLSSNGFHETLKYVRYRNGQIDHACRNHFFTDWKHYNTSRVRDITGRVGGAAVRRTLKNLNRRSDGSYWVEGIPVREEAVLWIPSDALTPERVRGLQTGDYIGFYTENDGLDVTHVGILIRRDENMYLRHASKRHGRVLDEPFLPYARNKPGIIILRPIE